MWLQSKEERKPADAERGGEGTTPSMSSESAAPHFDFRTPASRFSREGGRISIVSSHHIHGTLLEQPQVPNTTCLLAALKVFLASLRPLQDFRHPAPPGPGKVHVQIFLMETFFYQISKWHLQCFPEVPRAFPDHLPALRAVPGFTPPCGTQLTSFVSPVCLPQQ